MSKSLFINMLVLFLAVFSWSGQAQESDANAGVAESPDSLAEQLGYFYGYSFGNMLRDGKSTDVDLDQLMKGLTDSLKSAPPAMTDQQRDAVFKEVRRRQELAQAERDSAIAAQEAALESQREANLAAGAAYLAENSKREGVQTTASGLQYEFLENKEGPTAGAASTVVVHYKGAFIDGTVFDQSKEEPVEFGLSQVIPGWTEGLQLMSAGDKVRLHVPPDLAYGAGSVGRIPPNSVLVFDVELLEIK